MLQVVVLDMDAPVEPQAFIVPIVHSETLQAGQLAASYVSYPERSWHNAKDANIAPGLYRHCRLGRPYQLNGVMQWSHTNGPNEIGVWYTALYMSTLGIGPYWFRPLHTADGKGWLDPEPDGKPRFEPL